MDVSTCVNELWVEKCVGDPLYSTIRSSQKMKSSIISPFEFEAFEPHNGLHALKSPVIIRGKVVLLVRGSRS